MNRFSIPCANAVLAAAFGGLLLVSAWWSAALAQQQAPEPGLKVPEELFLPKDLPDGIGDKNKLLDDLYQQLAGAKSAEEAKLVTTAIERLWLRSGSDTIDLLMARAAKLIEAKKYDVALKLLDSVIELEPDYPEAWTRRAAIQFAKKKFGDSIESLRHALALDPSHYKAIEGLALVMQELEEKERALEMFRRALKVHPHLEDALQAVRELSREVEGQGI